MKKAIGILLLVLVFPAPVYAQYEPPLEFTEPLESAHFTIYYREDHTIIAQEVRDIAESLYDTAVTFMEYTPREKIEIYLYPSSYAFASLIAEKGSNGFTLHCGCPFSTESLGMDPLMRRQLVASGISLVLLRNMIPIGWNELKTTHTWLRVGIEQYYATNGENKLAPIAIHVLRERGMLPVSFDEISIEKSGALVYPLSFTIIQYMIESYGMEEFHTFLHSLEEWDQTQTTKRNVDRALAEAFGKTREEFEQGWLSWVEEFPVLEEKCDVVQITDSMSYAVPSSWYNDEILCTSYYYEGTYWNKNLDIYAVRTDGSSTRLTTDLACDFDPKFSPDGRKIGFTSLRDQYANVYIMNADGSGVEQITFEKSMDYMGSWSPDGKKIAFTSGRSGNYDIFVMSADGSEVTQITVHEGDDGWPVFSPDGQKILFVSDRGGSYDVYVMSADGSEVQQLTNTPEHENYPQYSPDGKKIVFQVIKDGLPEICIMNADGTGSKTMVSQPVFFLNERFVPTLYGFPVWSPDGDDLAVAVALDLFTVQVSQGTMTWIVVPVIAAAFVIAGVILIWWRRSTS